MFNGSWIPKALALVAGVLALAAQTYPQYATALNFAAQIVTLSLGFVVRQDNVPSEQTSAKDKLP